MKLQVERILAIDPGDVHCGWAILEWSGRGYVVLSTGVADPEDTMALVECALCDVGVLEDFRNYPGQGTWSQNKTSQLLGRMKAALVKAKIPFYLQLPAIKKVARGHMRARGVSLVKPDTDSRLYGHAYDAQAHGWYWLFQRGGRAIGGDAVVLDV